MFFSAKGQSHWSSACRSMAAFTFLLCVTVLGMAQTTHPQSPGYYRLRLGSFEITVISDGTIIEPVDTLLKNTTKAAVDDALREQFITGPYEMSDNCFLVNTGRKLILIDAGAGDLLGSSLGHFLTNLKAAGYTPEQIDEVYITHLHPDHIGGLVEHGERAFPNATLRVDQADIDYWLNDANLSNASSEMKPFFTWARNSVKPYKEAGRLRAFSRSGELSPGVSAIAAHGHTAGHNVFLIQSKGESLEIIGDLVHVSQVQLTHPEIAIAFDTDSDAAIASRRSVLADAALHGYLVGGEHISFPGIGHLRSSGSGFTWFPSVYSQQP
jgi:glyoxylase-like metal-dependent hydrolase (beta-lactamase superfamily II)